MHYIKYHIIRIITSTWEAIKLVPLRYPHKIRGVYCIYLICLRVTLGTRYIQLKYNYIAKVEYKKYYVRGGYYDAGEDRG